MKVMVEGLDGYKFQVCARSRIIFNSLNRWLKR